MAEIPHSTDLDDYLSKPGELEELERMLCNWLSEPAAREAA